MPKDKPQSSGKLANEFYQFFWNDTKISHFLFPEVAWKSKVGFSQRQETMSIIGKKYKDRFTQK